ncbi:hypothetical protein HK101_003653 [Irineochytrium annulatum]|nr:hypothetical protein HK101_003653 [Irineochytrium annulatum]
MKNGVMDEADDKTEKVLKEIITFMSRNFPDPKRAYGHLMKFATVNDRMMYQLLRTIMDANSDYKTIIKNNKEVLKRLEPHGGLSETFSILLRRISLTNLGKSSVARLLEVTRIAKAADRSDKMAIMMGAVAEKLVSDISKTLPGVYKVHVNTLLELIKSEDLALVSESLGALSQFVKTSFGPFAFEGDAVDVMKKLALSGSRMDASRASTVLAKIVDPEPRIEVLNDIVDSFTAQAIDTAVRGGSIQNTRDEDDDEMDTLDRDDDEGVDARTKVVARLTSLGQLALYSPEIFEDHSSFLTDFLLKEILMKNRPNSPHQLHDDGAEVEWVTLDKLDVEGQLKVLAVKYYVKRLRGLAKVAENDAKASESKEDDAASMQVAITSSIPVYNMLNRILQRDGEIVKTDDTPALIRSHLVLVATISLIKLSSFAKYDLRLTPLDRCRLSLTIQDPKWQVRSPVIDKLRKLLSTREIPFQFHVLLMITAHEPDVEIKNKARTFLLRQAKLQRTAESNAATLEGEFTMLLYMLAHHPDFGTKDVEDINNSAKYIDFFLDIIATADNVSYLFHCAAQLKTVQDRTHQAKGIYHLSDLAQYLIQDHCAQHGWSLPSYPASIPTNRELFKKLPTAEGAENFKINYLSKEWVTERQNMPHPPAPKRGRKSLDGAGSMTPLKGAQSPRSGAASPAGSDDEAPAPKRGRKKGTGATKKAPAKKAGGKGKGAGTRKPRATKKGKKNDNDDDEEEDEDEVMTDEVMADGTGADSDEEAPAKKGRAKGKGAGTRKPRATKKGKKNDEDDDEEEEEEDEVMADEVMADGAGADSEEPAPTKGTGRARRKGAATTRAPKPRTTKAKLSDDDDDDGDDDDALVDEPAAKKAKGGAAGKKSGDKNSSVPDSLIVSSGSDPGANAAMDVDDPDDDKKKRLRRGKRCAATFVVGD